MEHKHEYGRGLEMNGHVLNAAYAGFYVNEQYGKVMMIMTENGIEGRRCGWDDGTKKLAYTNRKAGPILGSSYR